MGGSVVEDIRLFEEEFELGKGGGILAEGSLDIGISVMGSVMEE
ncbi:hypothetical protein A2U01_0013794 [Trifolium medium]|uniref:Uncharacterized protein n=1 Tax=Trifolium medium TaxID=97028 RepID=A0A392MZA5_9FABA|nr:hypothetical protein [Trifolium medium]